MQTTLFPSTASFQQPACIGRQQSWLFFFQRFYLQRHCFRRCYHNIHCRKVLSAQGTQPAKAVDEADAVEAGEDADEDSH